MIHFQIRYIPEVTSTNTVALEEATQGAAEGLVILTDHQTSGRGKPGNDWFSPRGKNLLFSVLIRPPLRTDQAPLLTQIACRAVAKVLKEKYAIGSEFKRPNDVMVGNKKICGTLVEALSTGTELEAAVIGIGLNVNAEAPELIPTAISMKMITGKTYPLEEILEGILDELNDKLREWYKTGTIK
ncbi:MAG TPA: biotin--[acetyl-CoA-carboxylase] ligase [Candidatus Omnitrophota bacterium]|nr:biotin--[acetyl-CoA-carboxylase] ligase [Candidatus Omnitrophota bacterium]HPS36950.1 biotin--[acetyl-CoA-carboxylase] ligase [Candidatus Omnitrophota bacterium]